MLTDARQVPPGTEITADVAIVGAGPAGITIADRLRGSGLSVVLLEAGGFHPAFRDQRVYAGENVGHPYFRLDACRFRLLGGSTNRWGGWCRPLEDVDYSARDWVPGSGWPIGNADLSPFYADSAKLFQLRNADFAFSDWAPRLPEPFPLQDTDFENTVFQYSPETNFGEEHRPRITRDPAVTTLLHANVTDLRLDPGTSRVGWASVQARGREPFTVRARSFVVATGGLENPRLLLAARTDRPAGLGNEHDLVGRYFQEHLHVPAGHLVPGEAGRSNAFYLKAMHGDDRVRGVITPTPEAQERHGLLNCSIGIENGTYTYGTPFVGWPPHVTMLPIRAYRSLRDGRAHRLNQRAKVAMESAYGVGRMWATRRVARDAVRRLGEEPGTSMVHSLYFRTEQVPDPQSRVTLGTKRDDLGMPQIRLDWKVGSQDTASIEGWLGHLAKAFANNGIGTVLPPPPDWQDRIIGGPHHMGTTRMATAASQGVVDADCKVHSVDNLYIAGSSVFATGGYANPTFTIVALALRLADRLRRELGTAPVII